MKSQTTPAGSGDKKKQGKARKLALSVAAMALLAVGGTFSAFTDTTENGPNTFEAGVLSITDNDGESPLFTVTDMKATQTEKRCIVVENDGSLPFDDNTLTATATADAGLDQALNIKVERGSGAVSANDCSAFVADAANPVVYDGPIASLNGHSSAEETLAVGASEAYRITASTNDAPDAAQGDSASFQLQWAARDN